MLWTAPHYIQAEDEYFAELERERRIQEARAARTAAWLRKQKEIRRKNAITRATARSGAVVEVAREKRPEPAETQVVTTDEEWLAAALRIVPGIGIEACQALLNETAGKYRKGELAEADFMKVLDLLMARTEALKKDARRECPGLTSRSPRRSPASGWPGFRVPAPRHPRSEIVEPARAGHRIPCPSGQLCPAPPRMPPASQPGPQSCWPPRGTTHTWAKTPGIAR